MKGDIYKSLNPICPECIIELEERKEKLGRVNKWLVCPNCGIRISKASYLDDVDPDRSVMINELNNNGGRRINK